MERALGTRAVGSGILLERQLKEGSPPADLFTARARAETAAESVVEFQISPAVSEQEAITAALQKQNARAPRVPHHLGPKAKPAETVPPFQYVPLPGQTPGQKTPRTRVPPTRVP